MIAERKTISDGQTYEAGEEIPDLGSLECIRVDEGMREYRGKAADSSKLPKYDNLATGSTCLMVDTGDEYEYLASDKTWYKRVKSSAEESVFTQTIPTTRSVGGLDKGSIVTGQTAVQTLSSVLFGYADPSISLSLSCNSVYGLDEQIVSVLATANIEKGSENIASVKFLVNDTVVEEKTDGVSEGGIFEFEYAPTGGIKTTTKFEVMANTISVSKTVIFVEKDNHTYSG